MIGKWKWEGGTCNYIISDLCVFELQSGQICTVAPPMFAICSQQSIQLPLVMNTMQHLKVKGAELFTADAVNSRAEENLTDFPRGIPRLLFPLRFPSLRSEMSELQDTQNNKPNSTQYPEWNTMYSSVFTDKNQLTFLI